MWTEEICCCFHVSIVICRVSNEDLRSVSFATYACVSVTVISRNLAYLVAAYTRPFQHAFHQRRSKKWARIMRQTFLLLWPLVEPTDVPSRRRTSIYLKVVRAEARAPPRLRGMKG